MKRRTIILVATFVVGLSLTMISCEKGIDTEKPVITWEEPVAGEILSIGDERGVHFDIKFSDNIALGSYKVDIHGNFDGHVHSSKLRRISEVADSVSFSYVKTWNDIEGLRNKSVHHHEIKIPKQIDGKPLKAGKYHFVVYCVDKAGNESFAAREVILSHEKSEHHPH